MSRKERLVDVLTRMDIGKENWTSAVACVTLMGDDAEGLAVMLEDGLCLGIGWIDHADAQELINVVSEY